MNGQTYYSQGILIKEILQEDLDSVLSLIQEDDGEFQNLSNVDTKVVRKLFDEALDAYCTLNKDSNPVWSMMLDHVGSHAGFIYWNTERYQVEDYLQRSMFPVPTQVLTGVLFLNDAEGTEVRFPMQENLFLKASAGWMFLAPTGLMHYQEWTLRAPSKAIATFFHSDVFPGNIILNRVERP